MDIHILRDGKQTGPFSEETVQVLLKQGSILINDLAWQPGMPEWLPLHAVLYPASRQQTGEPQPVTDSPARISHPIPTVSSEPVELRVDEPVDMEDPVVVEEPTPAKLDPTPSKGAELATPRQRAFLSYIGTPFKAELSKEQAALLVNDAMEDSKNAGKLKRWDEERLRLYPDLFAEEIKAKRENRAQHFLEICQTEGSDFFHGVTKAHTQVLVGYLDVRFPNWDQDERSAKYDYFFPAISEKFPQLLTKAAKGRFKYAEGPRVSPELARRPVVRAKPAGSFFGAVIRGIIFGGLVLGLVIAAVKYGRGELQLPFELPFDKNAAKPSTTAAPDKNLSAPPGIASPDIKPPPAVASTAAPAPASTLGTPAPRFAAATPAATPPAQPSAPPVVATTPPSPPAMVTDAPANPPPANPAALPSSVSLFDTPAPPAAATPAPATTTAGPAATPAPQVVMGRINKPTFGLVEVRNEHTPRRHSGPDHGRGRHIR
jgi:hypothetical protein